MAQHFLDSSVLLKRYRREIGSQWVLDLSGDSDQLIVSRLAHVEVTAAIVRRGRQAAEASQNVAAALKSLDVDMEREFRVVEFSEALVFRAIELSKVHGLRAADAIQLSCALLSRSGLSAPTEFVFVSADDELNAAAVTEGLRVENPNRKS